MNKSELLASLTASHQRIIDAIDDFSDLELIEPNTQGDWSIKDVLAHLAACEAELVKALAREIPQNKRPALFDWDDAEVEKQNAQWYAENKDRPLDRVMDDFNGARKQLLRQVSGYNDKDLVDPKKYKWLNGKTLAEYVEEYANSHDDEHIDLLVAWRDSRKLSG